MLTLQNIITDLNEDEINKVIVGGKKGKKETSTSPDPSALAITKKSSDI